MGAPIDVYYLARITSPVGCVHHLLIRLTREEFPNWDETAASRASEEVMLRRDRIVRDYLADTPPPGCLRRHDAEVVGEFQGLPAGESFHDGSDHPALDIWVAPTSFGGYWMALAEAASEEEFWRLAREDEDLAALGPMPPVLLVQAHYLNRGERGWRPPSGSEWRAEP